MTTSELRQLFLDYFAREGHRVVASSPLVPGNDPTLLFTNAGMVQFKDVFLGQEQRDYQRAASSQRCVRAGGKHNDLENVGYTARHHTFFEMLGNFSFGDYFKREAIRFAWQFITGELGIPAERLWVTVYQDDDEAADIWLNEIGIDPQRFGRLGEKDNFWSMGDTGPCGPCSELFYDHGPEVPGGPPGSADEDGDRYVEIWNLVFMQFDRSANGDMQPLPKPSVDTGMGLERIAAVMQGVHSNYDIDLFKNLIDDIARIVAVDDRASPSLRVIADHIRACAFLITDGVLPGNEGRGYVLRRIIRRAVRHGYELGVKEAFFHRLVAPLEQQMGSAYPELSAAVPHIEKVLRNEEERFAETLSQGMRMLEETFAGLSDNTLPGDLVFKLYDTYGFPVDLTADIARVRNVEVDRAGFETAMQAQRARARAAQKFSMADNAKLRLDEQTEFTGYAQLSGESVLSTVLLEAGRGEVLKAGEQGGLVLAATPFYAESGGQLGDRGTLRTAAGARFRVTDTVKNASAHVHLGVCEQGEFRPGDIVQAEVDAERRTATVLNHSATHLLHAALRKVLGEHVGQKGSMVGPQRLRFDFSHYEPLSAAELGQVETLVNAQIRANAPAETRLMSYDAALEAGAMALFGEKYGDEVRVLSLGDFSTELCGGTHVSRAGDIGLFRISSETGIAAGVRRIEAITGQAALDQVRADEIVLARLASLVKAGPGEVEARVAQALERNKALEKELQQLKAQIAGGAGGSDPTEAAVLVGDIKVLALRVADDLDTKTLRDTLDRLRSRLGDSAVVLGSATSDGKVRLVAGVSKDQSKTLRAGDLVNAVAAQVGGKGGGRPDFAQAGGSDPAALDAALASVPAWVAAKLG